MKTNKDGSILLIALTLVMLISAGSALLLHVSTQKAFRENRQTYSEMARIVAESGIHKVLAEIRRNPSSINEEFSSVKINGGTATISVTEPDLNGGVSLSSNDSVEKYYVLTSTGTWGKQTAKAGVLISVTADEEVDPEVKELFEGAIFSGGAITLGGLTGMTAIDLNGTGKMHANGLVSLLGGAEIQGGGTVSSSEGVSLKAGADILNPYVKANITAPYISARKWYFFIESSVDYSQFTDGEFFSQAVGQKNIKMDLEPFRVYSKDRDIPGQSYSDVSFRNGDGFVYTDSYISTDEMPGNTLTIGENQEVRPNGGVMYVEGNVLFYGRLPIEGCIVATGDIDVYGRMKQKSVNGLPAFISVDGNINLWSSVLAMIFEGRKSVYGLVYADKGEITVCGGAEIEGAFVGQSDVNILLGGSVDYVNSRPLGPNGENVMLGADDEGTGSSGGSTGGTTEGGVRVVRWII